MRRPWPGSLAGQLVLIVLVALVAGQLSSLLIFADERRVALRAASREQVLARTAGLVRLLEETPPELRERILRASSGGLVRFEVGAPDTAGAEDGWHGRNPLARQLRRLLGGNGGRPVLADVAAEPPALTRLIGFEPPEAGRSPVPGPRRRHGRPGAMLLSVQLADGSWPNARTLPPPAPAWAVPSLVTLGLSACLVGLGVLLAVRRVTRPMSRLAAAADALGRGEAPPPLPEAGPDDVRATVQAFNRMQARLRRFVDDRTRMLAAIGHDLRTPITSLRLRAEFVEDEDTKGRILATLDEMQRMVEGTLTFVREEAAASEPTRVVDLAALVESTASDLADLGAEVAFDNPGKLPFACRPTALRRALRNLLENAVRYGGRCRVGLLRDRDELRIAVEDDGPGIPEDQLERVLEPFVRLEESRSAETGGTGLGLAIARSIVRAHGGDIGLANRPRGDGLTATAMLPLPGQPAPPG